MSFFKYAACLAFGLWAAPAVRPVEKLSLDDIATWGGKGPLADSSAPFMGVYHFHGMSGALVADTTHCVSWDPTTRVLTCSLYNKAVAFADGRVSDAYLALDTSPTPRASGRVIARVFALLRSTVAFHFNEALTKAVVIAQPSLLSKLLRLFVEETLEEVGSKDFTMGPWLKAQKALRLSGAWVRNNYAPPPNPEPTTGYVLLPIWTKKDGLNKANLELLKAKAPGGATVLRLK